MRLTQTRTGPGRRPRPPSKLMSADVLVCCAFGLVAVTAWPTAGRDLALGARIVPDDDGGDHFDAQVARLRELQAAFHGAISYNGDPAVRAENLDFLETLRAPDATLTVGGNVHVGRDAVMHWFDTSAPPLIQGRNWASLTPLFRSEFEPDGDTADIAFVCVLVDPATNMVMVKTAFTGTARKVTGDWVFWHLSLAPATL